MDRSSRGTFGNHSKLSPHQRRCFPIPSSVQVMAMLNPSLPKPFFFASRSFLPNPLSPSSQYCQSHRKHNLPCSSISLCQFTSFHFHFHSVDSGFVGLVGKAPRAGNSPFPCYKLNLLPTKLPFSHFSEINQLVRFLGV